MFEQEFLKNSEQNREDWEKKTKELYERKMGRELSQLKTNSDIPLKYAYGPQDLQGKDENIKMPGTFPFTRGLHPLTYQFTPWMTQMLHGYGLPEETRQRTNKLSKEGMSGTKGVAPVLVECDLASSHGYDPDSPYVRGAVGVSGMTFSHMNDIEILFDGYDLERTRAVITSKGINDLPLLAMYIIYAKNRGYKLTQLNGQSQNRTKNSFITSNVRSYSPENQLKLQVELLKYTTLNFPRWNHTNLCGYNLREAGLTATKEAAFTLAEAIELTEAGIKAGLQPDDFVPRFSTQLAIGIDFFEEVAKFRAMRKLWAKIMRNRFKCKNEKSMMLRIHAQTAGSSLTAQQPLNNIVRTTLEILSAAIGGVQSTHTASYDEAINIPTEEAVTTALRVNHVIQHESGITRVSDPLGGSYFVEDLTDKMEQEISALIEEVETRGGFTKCMADRWFNRQIDDEAMSWREKLENNELTVVGLNKYKTEESHEIPAFSLDQERIEKTAIERVKKYKQNRDQARVKATLAEVKAKAEAFESIEQAGILMPAILAAMEARCTVGEVTEMLFEAMGCVYP